MTTVTDVIIANPGSQSGFTCQLEIILHLEISLHLIILRRQVNSDKCDIRGISSDSTVTTYYVKYKLNDAVTLFFLEESVFATATSHNEMLLIILSHKWEYPQICSKVTDTVIAYICESCGTLTNACPV